MYMLQSNYTTAFAFRPTFSISVCNPNTQSDCHPYNRDVIALVTNVQLHGRTETKTEMLLVFS